MTVDELHTAWAELDQLERESKHLAERLSVVHENIKSHKIKIDISVKGRPPINRLSLELFSWILIHSMLEPEFFERSLHGIAGVSHRWRDVILNTPTFWTSVTVTPDQQLSLSRRQLKRSCAAPLDILITSWYSLTHDDRALQRALDVILPHINHWRTLTISNNGTVTMRPIFDAISLYKLPSFRAILVHGVSGDDVNGIPYVSVHTPRPSNT